MKIIVIVINYCKNYILNQKNMQLKLCKIYQVVQILEKLKLFNKLRIKKINIQFNIMIVDIGNKNKDI